MRVFLASRCVLDARYDSPEDEREIDRKSLIAHEDCVLALAGWAGGVSLGPLDWWLALHGEGSPAVVYGR